MDNRHLCVCSLCGPGGELISIATYKRHQRDERLRPSSSGAPSTDPQPSTQTEASSPQGPDNPEPPLPSIPDIIEYTVNFLHTRNSAWRFPTSLVFATPPTKDSPHFTPKTATELRAVNSSFHLSLRDEGSAQVVGYECFLIDTLQLLESYDLPEDDPMVTRTKESITTTLEILSTLDSQKGAEWDRQVHAQKSPDTYLLTGACIGFLMLPYN